MWCAWEKHSKLTFALSIERFWNDFTLTVLGLFMRHWFQRHKPAITFFACNLITYIMRTVSYQETRWDTNACSLNAFWMVRLPSSVVYSNQTQFNYIKKKAFLHGDIQYVLHYSFVSLFTAVTNTCVNTILNMNKPTLVWSIFSGRCKKEAV